MKGRTPIVVLAVLALVILVPPEADAPDLTVRCIDGTGRDTECAETFAFVVEPEREAPALDAILVDFAMASAAAGPLGMLALLGVIAVLVLVVGLWGHGIRCALRRVLVTFAIGVPLCIGLVYASCFLDGRNIVLGPDAHEWVRASLHTQTSFTTGLLTPKQLVSWHYKRGFSVLNVSDKDSAAGGKAAVEEARALGFVPPLLVLVGEEWHANPDIVLVHIRQTYVRREIPEAIAQVHAEGGAAFIAHPWSKLKQPVGEILEMGVDGVEVVNGVIHGGKNLIRTVVRGSGKGLIGVTDYKFGPHVNALTLIRPEAARTPRGVIEALRTNDTRVLYAVPGGALTNAEWEANTLGTSGAAVGVETLLGTPRLRRLTWILWLAALVALWWLAFRWSRVEISRRAARILFYLCCVIEFVLPAGLQWQVRALTGPISVNVLLLAAAVFAFPLLVSAHVLARSERES